MTITLPTELEARLKAAAQARGMAVDDYARAVLEQAAQADRDKLLAEIDAIRAMTPPGEQSDSAELLRQARDERHGS